MTIYLKSDQEMENNMAAYKIFSRSEKSTAFHHKVNEDNYIYEEISLMNDEKLMLIVVADGMGGLFEGEKASKHAVEAFGKKIYEMLLEQYMERKYSHFSLTHNAEMLVELVREGIIHANQAVCEKADPFAATGTTLSVVAILGEYAVIANVGDSPIYYYDAKEKALKLVSRLHTKAEKDVEKGLYSRYTDFYYYNDHLLYKSLGDHEVLTDDDIYLDVIGYINPGDMFLVGSDGAFGRMREDQIAAIIGEQDEYNVLKKLFEQARLDKEDDQTAVLYKAR